MVVVGLPWTPLMEKAGSYYGATAIGQVTGEDLDQARAGKAWRRSPFGFTDCSHMAGHTDTFSLHFAGGSGHFEPLVPIARRC